MTVFLCGFMGCGKSTTGKILAKNLGLSYIDSDEFIVEQEGMTIPEIFEKKGEPYFRKVEAEVIKSLCGKNAVVSCGGGAMLNSDTAAYARENGCVVFMDVPFESCYERIKGDSNRPIVINSTPEELKQLYFKRYPIYRQNATIRAECLSTPRNSAEIIKNLLS